MKLDAKELFKQVGIILLGCSWNVLAAWTFLLLVSFLDSNWSSIVNTLFHDADEATMEMLNSAGEDAWYILRPLIIALVCIFTILFLVGRIRIARNYVWKQKGE